MYTCPVCDTKSDTLVCPSCGFDSSCDYENHPTLQQLSVLPDAVSRRREHRDASGTPSVEAALSTLRAQGWDARIWSAIEIILRSAAEGSSYDIALALSEHPSTATTGIRLMQRIANAGDDKAQLWMGQLFHAGKQVPADLQLAAYWYQKAATQGNETAKARLREFMRTELAPATVFELVKKYKLEDVYFLRDSEEFDEVILTAIDTYAGSARHEYPILMEDHSYSGTGKTGFVLTKKALYYNGGFMVGKERCPISRIKSVSAVHATDDDLYSVELSYSQNDTDSSDKTIEISSTPDREEVIRMVRFWKELLHLA